MTVNSRKYFVLILAVFCGLYPQVMQAQLSTRNVLYLHFEQKHIRSDAFPADSIFEVTYRLRCPKPCNFHGYDLRFNYDGTKIAPVKAFFEGTASASADVKTSNTVSANHEFFVEVLGSVMFDTSNHTLFKYRASVFSSLADSALISVSLVDVLTENGSGIDTVIIENAPGRDAIGWYPFAVAYVDSIKQPPIKTKLIVRSDSLSLQSDSIGTVAFHLDSLQKAFVRSGVFRINVDTSVLTVLDILPKNIFASISFQKQIGGDSVEIRFSSSSSLSNVDTAFTLVVKARHRIDTVLTSFLNPTLSITNPENLVSTTQYSLKPVRVFGIKKADTLSTFDSHSKDESPIQLDFSPSDGKFTIRLDKRVLTSEVKIQVFDGVGKLLYSTTMDAESMMLPALSTSGVFSFLVQDTKTNKVFYTKFSVVH